MADSKYGRIFTEDDVHQIVQTAIEREIKGADELDSIIASFNGTFPADEPLFILRAQDQSTPPTIGAYHYHSHEAGASQEHLDAVSKAARQIETWQQDNASNVKVAD